MIQDLSNERQHLNFLPYILTNEDMVIEVGDKFLELTEYMKTEVLGVSLQYLCSSLLRLNIDISELGQGQKNFFIFTKNLESREVKIEIKPVLEKSLKLVVFEEKPNTRFEEALPYVEYLYLTNKSGIAIYSVPDFMLLKANQTYLNLLNEPFNKKENSIGKSVDEIVEGYKGSIAEDIMSNLLYTGEVYNANEVMFDRGEKGITYWDLSITPICKEGQMKCFIEIYNEVTERVLDRKKLEEYTETIKQQKEQLEMVIENMLDPFFIIDKKGKFISMNSEAKKLYYQPETIEKIGDSFVSTEYFDSAGNKLELKDTPVRRAFRGEKVRNARVIAKRPDKELVVDINANPIYDQDGNISLVISNTRDVTEMVKNEELVVAQKELLLKAEKEKNESLENLLKMKDEFLTMITHEFKTPLNVIYAAIQTIETIYKEQMPDNVKKHIGRIRMNTFRQIRLVNNLLDITRFNVGHFKIEKKNMDIVFITRIIAESVNHYANQKGIELKFSSDIEYKEIAIDEEKYERILLNLISNAIKYTPKGKSIFVNITCKNKMAIIKVKDEGIGIPKNKQELIFERFGQVDCSLTRQAEGTGIGLSLAKTLVVAMGGTITVNSEVGKGSTFTVILPITKVRRKEPNTNIFDTQDNRIMQAIAIEFSDIYFD